MSQYEIELKVLDIDLPSLITALERVGAVRQDTKSIFDVYYEMEKGPSLKSMKKGMRMRYTQGKNIATFKYRMSAPEGLAKKARELEYEVGKEQVATLSSHGLIPSRTKYKKRISYIKGDVCFDIDLYPGIPALLEIEAPDESTIKKRLKKLKLEKNELSNSGTRSLFKRYGKVPLVCS